MYKLRWTKRAQKDAVKIEMGGFKKQVAEILATVRCNPYEATQQFEKFKGSKNPPRYSRRINIHHRFIYVILPNTKKFNDRNGQPYEGIIRIISMWSHDE